MRILSLGAGVQSSVLALMAAHGEIEPVDAAIFADTGWEPTGVYTHLEWMEGQLPYPVYQVSIDHRLQDRVREGRNHSNNDGFVDIPLHHIDAQGKAGMAHRRQCTRAYKIRPIRREIRRLMKEKGISKVVQIMGISLDESLRMRDPDVKYLENEYPLVDMRMTRHDCMQWWATNYPGRILSKSSCVGCPFHSATEWLWMRDSEPEQFADACEIDASIRNFGPPGGRGFLHSRRLPLAEAVEMDARQKELTDRQLTLWDLECSGYCGV